MAGNETVSSERGGAVGRTIRALPTLLVNQIAAGEVVERPASVVKEIVENALDAGARKIELELEAGGIELIRVTDDGYGMAPEQLPLAIAPHATSKISVSEDLDRIATFGFRGEALASIASVSRMSIRSRTASETAASIIEVEGVTSAPIKPAGGPVGTQVSVRNLFFNTPARRKFLRTPSTEQGHCVDVLTDLAMAHPGVAFVVRCDGRVVIDVGNSGEQSARQRAIALLGKELESELLEVGADRFDDARGLTLWGLVGTPALARATAKAQHVFLNGRTIRDKTVQHAIREAYRGLIEPGRHPTAVLMIEMDPAAVDVNVHPAKTEVRFRDQSMVHGTVLRAIRDRLARADLTPRLGRESGGWSGGSAGGMGGDGGGRAILPSGGEGAGGGMVGRSEWKPRETVEQSQRRLNNFVDYFRRPAEPVAYASLRDSLNAELNEDAPASAAGTPSEVNDAATIDEVHTDEPLLDTRPADRVLQVHNSYVVTQDEEGMVIIDQHALHERVMFEYLVERVTRRGTGENAEGGGGLESQRLLVPIVVPASPRTVERLDEFAGLFERIGVDAAVLSPTSIGVSAFPTFLFERGVEPGEFLSDLFERADAEGFVPSGEEALHEVLDMMACKAAIKAGNRLSDDQIRDLVKLRDAVGRSSNCPHGRPTTIRLTMKDLEKLFGRV